MASRWDRIKAIFSPKVRERLEEENLCAAEAWAYARHQVELEDYSPSPDPEDIAERNRIEYGSALMEDEGIAYHDRLVLDDNARPVPEGMTRLYHGGQGPIEESRWFTSSLSYAGGWASKNIGEVHYVDIPTDHPLIQPEWPDQSIARGFTWNGELPEEISRHAKPLAQNRERTDYDRLLNEAAEMAKYRAREPDLGMDR